MLIGEKTNCMRAEPLKSESHSFQALQDFTRYHSIMKTIKTDNAKTEIGEKQTDHCRKLCISQRFTELHSPWQNCAEHSTSDLSTKVRWTIYLYDIPLAHHHQVQCCCIQGRNCPVSRKLQWRAPCEMQHGSTPMCQNLDSTFGNLCCIWISHESNQKIFCILQGSLIWLNIMTMSSHIALELKVKKLRCLSAAISNLVD